MGEKNAMFFAGGTKTARGGGGSAAVKLPSKVQGISEGVEPGLEDGK